MADVTADMDDEHVLLRLTGGGGRPTGACSHREAARAAVSPYWTKRF